MESLMWSGVYALLLIVINGTVSSKLDNEHEVINLENVLATNDEKISEDYHVLKEFKALCQFASDCRHSYAYAYVCRARFCECADGFRPDETNTTCVGAVGMPCIYDNHCIAHAYCRAQTVCMCKTEYVESDDKWFCDEDSKASSHFVGITPSTAYFITAIVVCIAIFF
ncbi:uncharacterized protein LOC129579422 [Sitodiplosis mosellana]|uniref:uncharacterized protein LOC129579422 n=1 Tax=Sitodiplosis mosellana TaxID=263140 RepID=UPI00244375A5|nr:uncharacterized protein LOC129579422 [Sitodiplosis mosellana]